MQTTENKTTTVSPYLITSYSIARDLAKTAIWSEKEQICNWQGANIDAINGKYQVVTRTFGADLYSGLSGIALFLAEVFLRAPDPIIRETLAGTVKNILKQMKEKPTPSLFGFHSGRLGIGFSLWKIGTLMGNSEWKQEGLKIVKNLIKETIGDHEIDVISGAAGAIPVLLKMHKEENDSVFLEIAKKCGDFLLTKADKSETSWSWQTIPDNPGLTGYSHGTAGIATALIELYTKTENIEYWNAAMMAFQYERMHFDSQLNNWLDLRKGISPQPNSEHQHVCGEMWCHGAPGIALSRLRAYELTGRLDFLQEAQLALDTTYRSTIKSLASPENCNFSLCHGLAGNADILLTGGIILNNASYIQIAQQVGNLGSALYEKTETDWPSGVNDPTGLTLGMEPTPGLMLGSSGTGYFYLRLASPNDVENILMIK